MSFKYALFICCLLNINRGAAQSFDTLSTYPRIYPVSLVMIGAGLVIQPYTIRHTIQASIQDRFGIVTSKLDDYLQFSPIVLLYGHNLLARQPAGEWARQTRHLIISEVATLGTIYMLKRITQVTRPNGGSLSFPSGHTAQAFLGAAVFQLALKEEYPIWSYAAYVPPTVVGLMRILKNKHWSSDVLVGAGIGIFFSHLSYSFDLWNSKSTSVKDSVNVKIRSTTDGLALVWRF